MQTFFKDNNHKLVVAESCTGGLISQLLCSKAGASDFFVGSVVSYANEAKSRLCGVNPKCIKKHGAVSEKTAKEMAKGLLAGKYLPGHKFSSDDQRDSWEYYNGSEFVKIVDDGEFPRISDVSNSNKCRIALNEVRNSYGRTNLVVFSLVDNLVKGASGQAVQNMNIMFNLDEKLGLI